MLRLEEEDLPAKSLAVGSIDLRAIREGDRPGDPPRAPEEMLDAIRAIDDELDTSRIRPVAE